MMKNYNIEIKISKLFGAYDMNLQLDNHLNVLVGENGCGKTTIVKMINYIINNDFIALSKVPFESIELVIDNHTYIVKQEDLNVIELQYEETKIPISCHPDLRFIIKEALKTKNNFDQFYAYVIDECKNRGKYTAKLKDKEYCETPNKYLLDDIKIFNIKIKNIDDLSKCIYGSKYYLELIYNIHHKQKLKLISYPKVSKSYYYSFVDLDEKFYHFENINIFNKYKIAKVLQKNFLKNKKVKFYQNNILVYNLKNSRVIENSKLSSGEKKAIQFYKTLNNLNKNTIMMLDEPELSMSFYWKKMMIDDLKRRSKKSKVIIVSQQIHMNEESDLKFMVPIINR